MKLREKNNFSFTDLVVHGEPVFTNEDLSDGIEAFPTVLKLISGTVKVFNNSVIQEILGNTEFLAFYTFFYMVFKMSTFLDDTVEVADLFQNSDRVQEYLVKTGTLELFEAMDLMNAQLNLASIVVDVQKIELKPITCDPEKLANYIQSEDLGAVQALSEALCHLNTDQITELVRIVHSNLDIQGLIDRGEDVANRTLSYDSYTFTKDLASFTETLLNITALQPIQDDIPIVFHMELWSEEMGKMLDTAMNSDDIDFTL
jgi:hypothetical protein